MKRFLSLLLLCVIGITSVQARTPAMPNEPANLNYRELANELKRNQDKWYSQRLRNYSYVVTRQCHCSTNYLRPTNVRVVNGQMQGVNNTRSPALSIKEAFLMIHSAIQAKAVRIQVKYHPRLGYPMSIYIDRSARIVDEEMGITISQLQITKATNRNRNGDASSVTRCTNPRSPICTREYKPVCGMLKGGKAQTFSNGCTACANPNVQKYSLGACSS